MKMKFYEGSNLNWLAPLLQGITSQHVKNDSKKAIVKCFFKKKLEDEQRINRRVIERRQLIQLLHAQ